MALVSKAEVYAYGQIPTDKQTTTTNALMDDLIDKNIASIEKKYDIKLDNEDFTSQVFNHKDNCYISTDRERLFFTGKYRDIYSLTSVKESGAALTEITSQSTQDNDFYKNLNKGFVTRNNSGWSGQKYDIEMTGSLGKVSKTTATTTPAPTLESESKIITTDEKITSLTTVRYNDGRALVQYADRNAGLSSKVVEFDGTQSSVFIITTDIAEEYNGRPGIAIDGTNLACSVWTDRDESGTTRELYFSIWNYSTNSIVVTKTRVFTTTVSNDRNGRLQVKYHGGYFWVSAMMEGNIKIIRISPDGTLAGETDIVATKNTTSTEKFVFGIDSLGNCKVIYEKIESGSFDILYYKTFNLTTYDVGTETKFTTLSDDIKQQSPSLVVNSDNEFVVAYLSTKADDTKAMKIVKLGGTPTTILAVTHSPRPTISQLSFGDYVFGYINSSNEPRQGRISSTFEILETDVTVESTIPTAVEIHHEALTVINWVNDQTDHVYLGVFNLSGTGTEDGWLISTQYRPSTSASTYTLDPEIKQLVIEKVLIQSGIWTQKIFVEGTPAEIVRKELSPEAMSTEISLRDFV